MKKTIAYFAALCLVTGACFGCGGDPKPDPNDPTAKTKVLQGNTETGATTAGGTTAPTGRGITPGEATKPPAPPAK